MSISLSATPGTSVGYCIARNRPASVPKATLLVVLAPVSALTRATTSSSGDRSRPGKNEDSSQVKPVSGAIASGVGYVIWYAAVRGLTATRAATVQLSVPVIAAFGGVILLSEQITPRLLIASCATLGGVAIVLANRTASVP